MTDIQAKYQKLATEYSKLRAQLPVLKKAVLDEQAKEDELKGLLREKETSLRKSEQELEGLTFRNHQLSARVEVLQQELSGPSVKNKKASKNQQHVVTPEFNNSVIGEELHKKIEENARLHTQVYESEDQHKQVVSELQERLMRMEEQSGRHQHVIDNVTRENRATTQKLVEEKAMLEAKLQNQQTDTNSANQRATSAEETLRMVEEDLSTRLQQAQETIAAKLSFNDLAIKSMNTLNIPSHNRRQQLQSKEIVSQAAVHVKLLTQALSNLYTYSEQRVRVYPGDAELTDVNKKLCHHLHDNASSLRLVEQTFRDFSDSLYDDSLTTLETAIGLQEFSMAWKSFVLYATKLLPYQLLSLEEECATPSCTEMLQQKNMTLHAGLQAFTASLTKLDTYVTLLAAYSGSHCSLSDDSQPRLLHLLSNTLFQFHHTIKDLSKQFNAKISFEHQLPTCSKSLKTTDECIVSALISLVTCTDKLSTFFAGNLNAMCQMLSDAIPCHPTVASLRHRATSYISTLTRPPPESVPHTTAVHNRRTLFSWTESQDSLTSQLLNYQQGMQALEADKEHWMLEAQLGQVKHDKTMKRVLELESQLKLLQQKLSMSAPIDNHTIPVPSQPEQNHSEPSVDDDDEHSAREQLIKQHFGERIGQMVCQLQQADSKALYFQAECRALHKRLSIAQKERDGLQEEQQETNQTIAQLKDELSTTTRSYEGQLSMMSEHLAGMNDKLSTQTDQIDSLKFQLNTKGDKKSRRK